MNPQPLSALQGVGEASPLIREPGTRDRPDSTPAIPETLALLPVRGFVVFPRTVSPLNVQRASSVQLLNKTLPQQKII